MKTLFRPHIACSRLAMAALLLLTACILAPGRAAAADCGGPLSDSTGNIVGSVGGAVAGGLLGSQFGGGAGKGLITGLGVVGGALAGGYVGRQAEGCPARRPQAATAAGAGRSCQYVRNAATIDGQSQQVVSVACLDADNVWRPASGPAAEQAANLDQVLKIQQRLHDQGYYVNKAIDGRWGPGTAAALRNYQRANNLAASGQLDAPTRTALGLDPVQLADLNQNTQQAQQAPPAPAAPTAQPAPATTPVSADHSAMYK